MLIVKVGGERAGYGVMHAGNGCIGDNRNFFKTNRTGKSDRSAGKPLNIMVGRKNNLA